MIYICQQVPWTSIFPHEVNLPDRPGTSPDSCDRPEMEYKAMAQIVTEMIESNQCLPD